MQSSLVVTILGPDQRGLVRSIARIVENNQGNWVESRLARLAGQFAGVIRMTCPQENQDALKEQIHALEEHGIRVNLIEEVCREVSVGPTLLIEILGNDRRGIIHELTDVIAQCGGNVEELVSDVESAAMSGGLIFRARGVVSFAEATSISLLQSRIEELSDDLNVSISDSM